MPLSTVLGAQSLIKPGVCTTATRPSSPFVGQAIYDTTLSQTLAYNGSAWVVQTGGLVLISSATFSSASTVSLPINSFTSTYSNYKLIVNITNSSHCALNFRYRASGTDFAGSYYNNCGFTVTSAGTIANDGLSGNGQTSNKSGYLGNATADCPVVNIDLYRPNEAIETRFSSRILSVNSNATVVADNHCGGLVYQTTQYDSLTLIPSASTISGTYRLYGLANS